MISALNRLVGLVQRHLTQELDVNALARELGTTQYHLRRMFSSLAGMPLSEYVRRRRMTLAAADVSRRENVAALVQLAMNSFGRLDVLINNAGVMPISPSMSSASRTGRR